MTGSCPIPAWGVAGAAVEPSVLVLTGVAGLLAGAFSMAAGEYVSMLSQKEMFEHQIAQEKDELERYPKEEAEELALIYAARGRYKPDGTMVYFICLAEQLAVVPDGATVHVVGKRPAGLRRTCTVALIAA
jgi:hypothetical protein